MKTQTCSTLRDENFYMSSASKLTLSLPLWSSIPSWSCYFLVLFLPCLDSACTTSHLRLSQSLLGGSHNSHDHANKGYERDKAISNSCITHEVLFCLSKIKFEVVAICTDRVREIAVIVVHSDLTYKRGNMVILHCVDRCVDHLASFACVLNQKTSYLKLMLNLTCFLLIICASRAVFT